MAAFGQVKVSTIVGSSVATTDAAIGVDKTYEPVGYVQPGVAKWEDRSSGIAVAYPSLTLSIRPPTKGSRLTKVAARLSIPTLEAISGANVAGLTPAQQVAYACAANMEFLLPERATSAEKTILLNQVISLFMFTITASDGTPTDPTGTPMRVAMVSHDRPY